MLLRVADECSVAIDADKCLHVGEFGVKVLKRYEEKIVKEVSVLRVLARAEREGCWDAYLRARVDVWGVYVTEGTFSTPRLSPEEFQNQTELREHNTKF